MTSVDESQPKEASAKRQCDTVVRVAAEDAHQQHQYVDVAVVLRTDTIVLSDEKRHDALRGELQKSLFVTSHEIVQAWEEEQQEECSAYHTFRAVSRIGKRG